MDVTISLPISETYACPIPIKPPRRTRLGPEDADLLSRSFSSSRVNSSPYYPNSAANQPHRPNMNDSMNNLYKLAEGGGYPTRPVSSLTTRGELTANSHLMSSMDRMKRKHFLSEIQLGGGANQDLGPTSALQQETKVILPSDLKFLFNHMGENDAFFDKLGIDPFLSKLDREPDYFDLLLEKMNTPDLTIRSDSTPHLNQLHDDEKSPFVRTSSINFKRGKQATSPSVMSPVPKRSKSYLDVATSPPGPLTDLTNRRDLSSSGIGSSISPGVQHYFTPIKSDLLLQDRIEELEFELELREREREAEREIELRKLEAELDAKLAHRAEQIREHNAKLEQESRQQQAINYAANKDDEWEWDLDDESQRYDQSRIPPPRCPPPPIPDPKLRIKRTFPRTVSPVHSPRPQRPAHIAAILKQNHIKESILYDPPPKSVLNQPATLYPSSNTPYSKMSYINRPNNDYDYLETDMDDILMYDTEEIDMSGMMAGPDCGKSAPSGPSFMAQASKPYKLEKSRSSTFENKRQEIKNKLANLENKMTTWGAQIKRKLSGGVDLLQLNRDPNRMRSKSTNILNQSTSQDNHQYLPYNQNGGQKYDERDEAPSFTAISVSTADCQIECRVPSSLSEYHIDTQPQANQQQHQPYMQPNQTNHVQYGPVQSMILTPATPAPPAQVQAGQMYGPAPPSPPPPPSSRPQADYQIQSIDPRGLLLNGAEERFGHGPMSCPPSPPNDNQGLTQRVRLADTKTHSSPESQTIQPPAPPPPQNYQASQQIQQNSSILLDGHYRGEINQNRSITQGYVPGNMYSPAIHRRSSTGNALVYGNRPLDQSQRSDSQIDHFEQYKLGGSRTNLSGRTRTPSISRQLSQTELGAEQDGGGGSKKDPNMAKLEEKLAALGGLDSIYGTGERRGTLPSVLPSKDDENNNNHTDASEANAVPTKTPRSKDTKLDKSPSLGRKASIPSHPEQLPLRPEWEREKVSHASHAAREAKIVAAMEGNKLKLSDLSGWIYSHLLFVLLLSINVPLGYLFYVLLGELTSADSSHSGEDL